MVGLVVGCLTRGAAYECQSDEECTLGSQPGVCEANGYCSYLDSDCDSGRRYSRYAEDDADRCLPTPVGTGSAASSGTSGLDGSTATASDGSDSSDGVDSRWLLTIDESESNAVLMKIDRETGEATPVRDFDPGQYRSLTFTRNNVLHAIRVELEVRTLETIPVCAPEPELPPHEVGPLMGESIHLVVGQHDGLAGLVANKDPGDPPDVWMSIDPENKAATSMMMSLVPDVERGGVAWWDREGAALFLEQAGDGNTLIRFDPYDAETPPVSESLDLSLSSAIGIDVSPAGKLYVCHEKTLYHLNPETGAQLGTRSLEGELDASCDNLASPWAPLGCLDDP